MTTRKPFSIRTQNELNISNKTNEEKAEKRNMASKKQTTKIIKVNTKTNSKIYINKKDNNGDIKLVSGNTNALLAPSIEPSVEGVQQKKIADDIENAPPTMNDKEVRVDQPHDAIISKNEESLSSVGIFLGKEGSVMRNTYSIHQLLKMEPKVNTKPIGFENWPEELRNPKPREIKTPIKKNNGNNKPNSVFKKRSPSGESSPLVVNITSNINNATKCIEQSNILEKFNIAANENNGIITKDTTNVAQIQPVQFIPVQTLKPLLIEKTTVASPSSPLKLDLTPIKNTSHIETDDRRLDQRQKQIDLGKKTLSYYMYCKKVPIFERKKGCPVTPRKNQICSKRSWDGQVRKWRRMLHDYDPKSTEEIEEAMRLFPDETKYLLQKRQEELEGKTTSNDDKEKDEENFD